MYAIHITTPSILWVRVHGPPKMDPKISLLGAPTEFNDGIYVFGMPKDWENIAG